VATATNPVPAPVAQTFPIAPKYPELTEASKLPVIPPAPPATVASTPVPPTPVATAEPKNDSWMPSLSAPDLTQQYNAFTAPRPKQPAGSQANGMSLQGYPMPPMMVPGGMPMMAMAPVMNPGMMPMAYGPPPFYRQMPTAPTAVAVMPANPAMDRPSAVQTASAVVPNRTAVDVPGQLRNLSESAHPSERESAVLALGEVDWRFHTRVLPAVNEAAVKDPAPLVRAACVAALVRMRAPKDTLSPTLDFLANDRDIRVRHEVDAARNALKQQP
jgi:hypothetical protein